MVGVGEQVGFALGMTDHMGIGMPGLERDELLLAEGLVHDAGAVPQLELTPGLLGHPLAQVAIEGPRPRAILWSPMA